MPNKHLSFGRSMPSLLFIIMWLSCFLIFHLTILSNHIVAAQQAAAAVAQTWLPGPSNQDFLRDITIPRDPPKDSSKPKRDKNTAKDNEGDDDEDASAPFDFFRLFNGHAKNPDSDVFLSITQFLQSLGANGDSSSLPVSNDNDNNNNNAKNNQDGSGFWESSGLDKEIQQLSSANPTRKDNEWWTKFQQGLSKPDKMLTNLFLQADGDNERKEGFMDTLRVLSDALDEVKLHFNDTFGEINFYQGGAGPPDLIQFLFFMDHEEAVKNAVWKRRVHRHYRALTTADAESLYPGLYLAQLAYTHSCTDMDKFAQLLGENRWVMRNCTTVSKPQEPAHFLAVRKIYNNAPADLGPLDFFNAPIRALGEWDILHMVLVVRGTKTVGDMLTDSVLKATPYRGGLAHDGIRRSALWLVESYKDDLQRLLKASGRKKIKLWLVGHSLGAGTAALAAIEFIECCSSWIDAEAVGFGTPGVLSPDLSYKYRDAITTVVTDADCVPRMSGATLVNAWHRIVAHDHSEDVLLEFDHFTRVMQSNLAVGQSLAANLVRDLRKWITDSLETKFRPKLAAILNSSIPFRENELIPPGECIHLYRDGTAWQGTYINCTFFNELDIVWHAVEDHLVPTGYYVGLLDFIRTKKQNVSWMFEHDLLEIPT